MYQALGFHLTVKATGHKTAQYDTQAVVAPTHKHIKRILLTYTNPNNTYQLLTNFKPNLTYKYDIDYGDSLYVPKRNANLPMSPKLQ